MRQTYQGYGGFASLGGRFPPGVKWLLIVNTALFVLYFFAVRTGLGGIFYPFGLVPVAVLKLFGIWQLFTYMFLHDPYGFTHILFNMLMLWMFGTDLERTWGTRGFLRYYFICGVGAGICIVIGNLLFGTLETRTIGASGAIFGLLLAFGMLFPNSTVLFWFLFPIKAKYFVMIMGAIQFMLTLGSTGSGVSHVAHLGGMIFGYGYLKWGRGARVRTNFAGDLFRQYNRWKMQRAKRKFDVYMRKRDSNRGPWVN
ncbi:MAG TPA: rhomboid family intramembrane serine protease [Bryobacteraceae bacterium]|nr:rhomboid family intramembrane serine protease [Bryobacteraceae bacterium]